MENPKTYVFFGNIGAGKGTQIELLSSVLKEKTGKDVVCVYPGNKYRSLVNSDNYTGSIVKDTLTKGELQADFLTNSIAVSILIDSLKEDSHIIFDGYPRSLNQSEIFTKIVSYYKRENVEIIHIEVSKDEAVKRMKLRARHDDTEEGIKKRFEEYEKNVLPTMSYLKEQPYIFHTINGEQTVEDVHKDIIKALSL